MPWSRGVSGGQYTTAQTFASVGSYSSTLYLRKACQILWGGKARVNFLTRGVKRNKTLFRTNKSQMNFIFWRIEFKCVKIA